MRNIVREGKKDCIICGADFDKIRTTKPCASCVEKYLKTGTYLIEIKEITKNGKKMLTATGNFAVMEDDLFAEMFPNEKVSDTKAIMVPIGLCEAIVKAQEKAGY